MFQCPHLHTLPEGPTPPHRPADEKDTPPATICKSFESSASSKRSSRIANSVLSEVADQHVGNLEVPFTECMLIKHAKGTVWFMHFHQVWSLPRTDIGSKHSFRPSQLPIDCSTFRCHSPTASSNSEPSEPSEVFLHLIAIQILASCYTLSRPPGAASLPSSLYLSKRELELITSLRLHTQFRYCPAAGHHARNSSRDSSWPVFTVAHLLKINWRRKWVVAGF